MPAGPVTRRSFLAGAAAAVVTAGSAACSSPRTRDTGEGSGTVVVSNHPLYIDAGTNAGFEAATGIHVDYHEDITDDGAWLTGVTPRLQHGESIDRDVVIVSDWVADRLRQRGWLAEIQPVTWALGMVGIAYDSRAPEITAPSGIGGGGQVTEIAALFQSPLRGRVALPVDMRTTLGMALLADRTDPSTVTLDQATATAGRLANSVRIGQVALVRDPIDELVAGTVAAAVVPASDTVGLEGQHPDLRFVVPDEGGLLRTDLAVVLARAPNPPAAARYLAYVADPARAAARLRVLPVLSPPGPPGPPGESDSAGPVDSSGQSGPVDPRRDPAPEVRSRLRTFRFLNDDEDAAFTKLFDGVLHANR